uniref:Uncharacterized protein n=1 Tax=Arundo donax TaxID=35708 RepID=A0A0A9D5V6_ARUDO
MTTYKMSETPKGLILYVNKQAQNFPIGHKYEVLINCCRNSVSRCQS